MLKTKNKNIGKRYYGFMFLVLALCVISTIFGVSYAYLSGTFSNNNSTNNPYVSLEFYYNDGTTDYKIDKNGITGTISSGGAVSLQVKSGSATKSITISSGTFSLPIKIKNAGNVDAVVTNVQFAVVFKNGTTVVNNIDNSCGNVSYYIQLVSSSYSVEKNSSLVLPDTKIGLTAKGANAATIINSVKVGDGIADTDLCGKNFVINISAVISQQGYNDLQTKI